VWLPSAWRGKGNGRRWQVHRVRLNAYDLSDVIFNLWSRLEKYPLTKLPLETMFVDETQDFTQAGPYTLNPQP